MISVDPKRFVAAVRAVGVQSADSDWRMVERAVAAISKELSEAA